MTFTDTGNTISAAASCSGGGALNVPATCPVPANGSITILTGDGDDTITTSGGWQVFFTLTGSSGNDTLTGGAARDTLGYTNSPTGVTVDLSTNTASGGDAQGDIISGIENVNGSFDPGTSDTLTGNGGDNTLDGNDGADNIFGGDGNDRIIGGFGADNLQGEAGFQDLITGGPGGDTISGGAGSQDYSLYTGSAAINVTIGGASSGGDAAGDTLQGDTEFISGTAFDDTITGDDDFNDINGEDGNDTIFGGQTAADTTDDLIGGPGADAINGGAGDDGVNYFGSPAGVTVNLNTGTGSGSDAQGDTYTSVEDIAGSEFNDTLTGSAAVNLILGRNGDDVIDPLGGVDELSVIDGNDFGNDTITSRDGEAESVRCSGGAADVATVDAADTVDADCETVNRPAVAPPPPPPPVPPPPTPPPGATGPTGPVTPPTQTPVFRTTSNIGRVDGTVTFKRPGGRTTRLTRNTLVPSGTTVNTTKGKATILTKARDGRLQSAQFSLGTFRLNLKTADGATEAALNATSRSFARCPLVNRFLRAPARSRPSGR